MNPAHIRLAAALTAACGYALFSSATTALAADSDAAKTYPNRPIRMIVPFPPGGSNDILGRFIGQKLTERLGQQTVIDNRAGADGIIGTDLAAKSAPDGYTLLIVSTSFSMNPAIHKLPYDPLKSLTAIALIGRGPNLFATTPSLPVKSMKELIALAKAKPGQLHYASSGVGGFNHFGGELLKTMAGIDIVHVPYKGGGPAMIDVMSGQVEVLVSTLIQALPYLKTGKLRPLGVGGLKRTPALPDVPTVAEAGVPGYDCSIWWGILGPAGMPGAIVTKLNTEMAAILRDPETAKRLVADAAEPAIETPQAFSKLMAADLAKWQRVAKEANIHAQN